MSTNMFMIHAAFEEVSDAVYEHRHDLDLDGLVKHCVELASQVYDQMVEAEGITEEAEETEDFQQKAMTETLLRVFEAGYRVGAEVARDGIEVTVRVSAQDIAGLVQQAINRSIK